MNTAFGFEPRGTLTLEPSPVRPSFIDCDRRCGPRIAAGVSALLRSLDGEHVLACPADDLGEGGLHIHAPLDLGLAVGQRYQVIITEVPDAAAMPDLCGEENYATVLRTETRAGAPGDHVGVGLRFDQPIFF
jgi:hypothetical protein